MVKNPELNYDFLGYFGFKCNILEKYVSAFSFIQSGSKPLFIFIFF